MVHFYVAYELAVIKKVNNLNQFYSGILAPDAYLRRKERSYSDRHTTHFIETMEDLLSWQNNTIYFLNQYKCNSKKYFYTGYGIHILTDIYWEDLIYKPFRLSYAEERNIKENVFLKSREEYLENIIMIDLWLYRNCKLKDELWTYLCF